MIELADKHLATIGVSQRHHTNLTFVAEALRRNLEVKKRPHSQRIVVRYQGRARSWRGGNTNHNGLLAKKMVHFKDVCNRHLRNHGIIAPENAVFASQEVERAWQWAQPLGKLVIKPNNGLKGQDVHVGIETWKDFVFAFNQVAQDRGRVLVEEFRPGIEHRCLVVENAVVAVTKRRPASVLGDGSSTIAELVKSKNRDRGPIHYPLSLGPTELEFIGKLGFQKHSIPTKGERVYLRLTSNIHTGGDALDATDELTPDEQEMIERAARSIPDLRIAGFDVLLPRWDHNDGSEASVLEINASPMISMHHFPWEGVSRDVASKIMDSMFPKSRENVP